MSISLPWKLRTTQDKLVVLTGAGVSIASGLPGGPELCARLVQALCRKLLLEGRRVESLARIPLESVFQVLADQGLGGTIDTLISRIDAETPSAAHRGIAMLADQGEVSTIVTFNFDTLHEKSLAGWPHDCLAMCSLNSGWTE